VTPEILVAHSNGAVRDGVGGMLHRRGHAVEVAYNAPTAMAILAARRVDALLVTLHLPPKGYQGLLDAIADPPPTIVIGEQGRQQVPPWVGGDERVCGILVRPFSLQDLFEVVEAASQGPNPGA